MIAFTYLVFQAFGPQKANLLYTKEEKKKWDSIIGGRLGNWAAVTNIVGTLTSLATVYVFFIGSSKLFGWVTLWCAASILASSFITNSITRRICGTSYVSNLMASAEQVGGVIASVFWRNNSRGRQTALLAKWISLVTIASVIWLEFALFADIAAQLLGHPTMAWKLGILCFCCFTVTFFTLKYGLRGFVFADLFQSPMIFIGACTLLLGCAFLALSPSSPQPTISAIMSPMLSARDCALFVLQVASVNFFLVIVSESHWLRIWIFGSRESSLQFKATATTGSLWFILTLVGLYTGAAVSKQVGPGAIVDLLTKLNSLSSLFVVAFWVGGMAALFSTADAQIYSFLLVNSFDSKSGKLKDVILSKVRPLEYALAITALFAGLYYLRTSLNLPFEKMIFLLMPICLNVLPALIIAARGVQQHPGFTWIALALYAFCTVAALYQPSNEFAWTLAAPIMPILVAIVAAILPMRKSDEA